MPSYRLSSREEIQHIFKKGKKRVFSPFNVWVYRKKQGPFRILVITSKKVDKRATYRNTLKRRIREVFRKHIAPQYPDMDIIVQINPKTELLSTASIKEALRHEFPIP